MTDTRQRLIQAASSAFARCGLQGATTRQIAQDAGVNEVTLFRHFQTKEKLIAAVLQETFPERDEHPAPFGANPADLRTELLHLARRYEESLGRNILLVRTLVGEIHRHAEHEASVLKGIFAPLKAALVLTIEAARERGQLRPGVEPLVAADLLGGMILSEVLRRTFTWNKPVYSSEHYLNSAVEILVRGIEIAAPADLSWHERLS